MGKTARNCLIALGANLDSCIGTPCETLLHALRRLADFDVQVEHVSQCYLTPCFPVGMGPDYVNSVAKVTCRHSVPRLLEILQEIEAECGRTRNVRWGGRTLDLDILAVEKVIAPDRETYDFWRNLPAEDQQQRTPDGVILPHPRLQDRAFVLVPLADVAAEWCHPVSGLTVEQMLQALPAHEKEAVVPLDGSL